MPHLFSIFSRQELKNIAIYALGIMCYKFALEFFNGAFITLANERFGDERYKKIGILTGLNSAMQCVGSILIAPLIKKIPTRTVLSYAVLVFGIISSTVLIADAATGGKPKFLNNGVTKYGSWNPNGLFPIYIISGISYGMVELIRRVIPRDIVGGDVGKLRRMDATIHILYEVAGTAGAFTSTSLIGTWGYNYSSFLSPVLFALAALVWRFVSDVQKENRMAADEKGETGLEEFERNDLTGEEGYMSAVISGVRGFGKATYYGAVLVCSSRKYVWLVTGYSVALYLHRYLENGLAPIVARQILGNSSWSQIIVGGSNFGELLGALCVLLLTNQIVTPIPWLRFDALALNIVWILPFIPLVRGEVSSAWKIAGCFIPISFGWAAGDVSLAAYIQSTLAKVEHKDKDVSALGAVMAFLYVTYIVLYAVLSAVLGNWVDGYLLRSTAREALKYVGGIQFTVGCVLVFGSTFIPRGSWSLNPKIIEDNISNVAASIADEEAGKRPHSDYEKKAGSEEDYHPGFTNGSQVPVGNKLN